MTWIEVTRKELEEMTVDEFREFCGSAVEDYIVKRNAAIAAEVAAVEAYKMLQELFPEKAGFVDGGEDK